MYWYTTGTWEETRDPDGFHAWAESKEGSLYPLYYPYQKPEDNPLFIGYDKNGYATYTNGRTVIGPYDETARLSRMRRTMVITRLTPIIAPAPAAAALKSSLQTLEE